MIMRRKNFLKSTSTLILIFFVSCYLFDRSVIRHDHEPWNSEQGEILNNIETTFNNENENIFTTTTPSTPKSKKSKSSHDLNPTTPSTTTNLSQYLRPEIITPVKTERQDSDHDDRSRNMMHRVNSWIMTSMPLWLTLIYTRRIFILSPILFLTTKL